jgi:phytoene/squalene synthetase
VEIRLREVIAKPVIAQTHVRDAHGLAEHLPRSQRLYGRAVAATWACISKSKTSFHIGARNTL